jgi:DNA-binding IclR family transcriptional regulator
VTDIQHKPAAALRPPVFDETREDRQFATTLARGLEVLRCFTPQAPLLGNKELVQGTGLPKATISRFTYTLTRLGYLRQVPGQTKYQLGSAVLSLGYPLLATMYVRQLARRPINELATEFGGSVALGVRDRLNMVYVETSRSSNARVAPPFTDIGYSHPIAATSMGRAYLAVCDPSTRKAILNEIRVKTPEDYRRYRTSIENALKDYVRLGFCVSRDFFRSGIYGVAVPIRRPVDGELLVFNCAVYADRVTPSELERRVGPRLLALCRTFENSLRP